MWIWLLLLAVASFLLSFAPLGAWSPVLALGIALAKAVLISAFFMHLVTQPSISRWAFALGVGLALLLMTMIGVDVLTRDSVGPQPRGLGTVAGPRTGVLDAPRTGQLDSR